MLVEVVVLTVIAIGFVLFNLWFHVALKGYTLRGWYRAMHHSYQLVHVGCKVRIMPSGDRGRIRVVEVRGLPYLSWSRPRQDTLYYLEGDSESKRDSGWVPMWGSLHAPPHIDVDDAVRCLLEEWVRKEGGRPADIGDTLLKRHFAERRKSA